MISPTQILDVNTDFVAGEVVDGEAVIINLSNGMYYTMDGVGAEVWQLIERRRSMHDMAGEIAARYGVDRETVLGDLQVVVPELVAEGLVRTANGSSTPEDAPVELARPTARYTKPAVTRYTDMSEVLALDPPLPELGAHRLSKS
jgi:hypothetical protein